MSLKEWNWIQCYLYKEFDIDPKDLKLIINIATVISVFKNDDFNIDLLNKLIDIVEKLIIVLGDD